MTEGLILCAPTELHEAGRGKIKTTHWRKPIPTNRFDWQAWRDGDEPNDAGSMRIGHGATEREAIAELLEMEEDAGL